MLTGEARVDNLIKKAPSLYDFVRFGADLYQVVPSWNELGLFGDVLARCSPVLGEQLGKVATVTVVVREFAEDVFHPFSRIYAGTLTRAYQRVDDGGSICRCVIAAEEPVFTAES